MRYLMIIISVFLFISTGSEALQARERKRSPSRKKWVKSKYGVKALIALSKDRGKMEREYGIETSNYLKVRKAIESGRLEKGEISSRIRKRYGEPVVDFAEDGGKAKKWVYKPGNKTFFEKEKIYLFFDDNDELVNWKMLEGD